MNQAIQHLNAALWRGIGTADDAIFPAKTAEVKTLCTSFLKASLDAPWSSAFRKKDKKGKPTRTVDTAVVTEWMRGLAAHLRAEAEAGRAIEFRVDRKGTRGYVPTPEGRARGELAQLAAQAEEVHRRVEALRASLSRFADPSVPAGPATSTPQAQSPSTTSPRSESGVDDTAGPVDRLRRAYRSLDAGGRGYVPIHKLRAASGLPRGQFDELVRKLRRELILDLQVGSPSDYLADEVMNSYMEADGTLFLTLSWRGA